MPRGRGGNNNNNNNPRGGDSNPNRSRGRGGRGGRGRGGFRGAPHFAGPSAVHPMAEIDFVIQRYDESSNPGSGTHTPSGKGYRGRGRGGFRGRGGSGPGMPGSFKSGSGSNTRGRGSVAAIPLSNHSQPRSQSEPGFAPYESPFARGGGRKAPSVAHGKKKASGFETLSDLLYSDRPLLKPIKFVRSTFTATLFETTEEILETVGGDEKNLNEEEESLHVPTADRVARVFSGRTSFVPPPASSSSEDEANGKEIEEIDFDDLGKLMEQQQHQLGSTTQQASSLTAVTKKSGGKETFTGFNFYERATTETLRDEEEVQNILVQDDEPSAVAMDVVVVVEDDKGRDTVVDGASMVVEKDVADAITSELPSSVFEVASAAPSHEANTAASESRSAATAAPPPMASPNGAPFVVDEEVIVVEDVAPIVVEDVALIAIDDVAPILVEEEAPPASALPDPDTLFFVDTQGTHPPGFVEAVPERKQAVDDLFFVDTEGSQSTSAVRDPSATAHLASARAPVQDRNRGAEPEEEIVYIAPHPKPSQQRAPASQEVSTSTSLGTLTRSIITGTTITAPSTTAADFDMDAASASFIVPPPTSTDSPPTDLLRSLRIGRTSPTPASTARAHVQASLTTITSSTPRSRKKQALKERVAAKRRGGRKNKAKAGGFGMYGAMASEAALRDTDPRYNERRRGDSDIEWGSDDDEDEVVEEDVMMFSSTSRPKQLNPEDDNDMSIDPECVSSSSAMRSFARGMVGPNAGVWTTIGDVEDAGIIREEDDSMRSGRWNVSDSDSDEDGEDEEVYEDQDEDEDDLDKAVRQSEKELIAEAGGLEDSDEDEDDDDDDDDYDGESSPGFEARLQKLRSTPGKPRSKGKGKAKAKNAWLEEDDDDSDEDEYVEDELIDELNAILDAHSATIAAKQKHSGRKKLFKNARKGKIAMDVDDFEAEFGLDGKWDGDDDGLDDSDDEEDQMALGLSPARKRSEAPQGLSPALLSQWEKDREKKASRKLLRQQSKLLHALDPLSGPKKGGKKGRKAMLLAAQMGPESTFGKQIGEDVLGGRVDSLAAIEAQIRQFLNLHAQESKRNRNIPEEIILPPMPKATRKHVHELALAFNLKSVSKGKGDGRYTTLIRTTRSGLGINEKKVAKIVRIDCQRHGMPVPERLQFSGSRGGHGGGGRGGHGGIKHREGEHVGSAAPKLSDTNLGFKMLAKLGWAEGDRIGLASRAGEEGRGLEQPLKAVIKISKLGLGATY